MNDSEKEKLFDNYNKKIRINCNDDKCMINDCIGCLLQDLDYGQILKEEKKRKNK